MIPNKKDLMQPPGSDKEYLIKIEVRNNVLLSLMREKGIKNASALAKATGVNPWFIGYVLKLKVCPRLKNGDVSTDWRLWYLAEFFDTTPDNLFPKANRQSPLPNNTAEIQADISDIGSLAGKSNPLISVMKKEQRLAIEDALSHLKDREAYVIRSRFGLDGEEKSLDEIGKELGRTRERIRQIESRAIEKLKHPAFAKILRSATTSANPEDDCTY